MFLPRLETETAEGGNDIKTLDFPLFNFNKWVSPYFVNSSYLSCLPLPSFLLRNMGKSRNITLETKFAGKEALCTLKGLVKLQALVCGHIMRKKANKTLICM